ncbi:MAG TPA: response regulator, partial [Polyangiaceae bacterium]|nr:response regulator [Polyangiaceae bacterium]
TAMKRILFVDDDAPLLEALRMRLRCMRSQWAMTFVDSGGQALKALQDERYDIIVSDVCMPGMSGDRLLRTVSERWPETVRIALSGLSDPGEAIRLAPIAHQFLSKPCEAPLLENAIERCLALQDLLSAPALRAIVGRIRKLPPLRGTYAALQSLLWNPNVTVHDVAEVITRDTVIAAKVLQVVNSAFFRQARRISSIEQAVTYLGFAAIRNLVMSAEVFAQWPDRVPGAVISLDRMQDHAHQVLAVSNSLTAGMSISDDAVLAALLHDIGYWVLAYECPRELERAHSLAISRKMTMYAAELEILGSSHAEVGAYLLGLWGLPYSVVEAVAHHHAPQAVAQTEFDVLAALATAHALAPQDDAAAFEGGLESGPAVDASYLASLRSPISWDEAVRRAAGFATPGSFES